MARLLAAEEVARAANLEVLHRDGHTGTELGVLRDRRQPVVRRLGERLLGRIEEVGITTVATAADPPAQLVELGEPERVGALDDEGVGVGDVEPALDDRRTDEDVVGLVPEVDHRALEDVLVHLPVRDTDARLRHEVP